MSHEPSAVVIGDMDLVRPLGLAGIPVHVAASPNIEMRWSRYVRSVVDMPNLWTDDEDAVERLISLSRRLGRRPVLLYQKDAAALAVSRHRERLAPHFRFVVPDSDIVDSVLDKERFHKLSVAKGLPVPSTVIAKAGMWTDGLNELDYPVAVKPALRNESTDKWFPLVGKAAKATHASTPAELRTLLEQPTLQGLRLVVQRLVPGPENRIWSYHAFVDGDGATRGEFAGRKIRTWPNPYGQSTAVEIVDRPEVSNLGRTVLRSLGYTGIAKVDFKEDPDGSLALLEVNPRFNLWHHPGAVAGVNLPAMVYNHLVGLPIGAATAEPGTTWCRVWGDRAAARSCGLSTTAWLRFAVTADSRRSLHLSDPGAIIGAMARGLTMRTGRSQTSD